MKRTIEDFSRMVARKYKILVVDAPANPRYIFQDVQTGAITSCPYDRASYNETVMELLGTI